MILSIIKIIHIVSAMSWMAGLFYLPRLFVYHSEEESGSKISEKFKIMEHKLFHFIMVPAMISTWITGITMALNMGFFFQTAFYIKVLSVLLMTVYHYYLENCLNTFKVDKNTKNHKFYRVLNEIPTILLIIIISVVVLKPYKIIG